MRVDLSRRLSAMERRVVSDPLDRLSDDELGALIETAREAQAGDVHAVSRLTQTHPRAASALAEMAMSINLAVHMGANHA